MIIKNLFLILKELGYKKIVFFGLLNILVLVLELLSFSMFIPFLLALTSKDKLLSNDYFMQFLNFFQINQEDTTSILFFLLILLIIVFFIKNLFIGLSKYFQYRISYDIEINLTSIVFQKYLRKPYLFHTSENSSKALRNIIGESAMFSRALLGSILSLIIETIVLIGIFTILYLSQPEISVKLIICFLILGLIFYIMFKKKFSSLGKERQTQDSHRIKYAQQGIQGIKEIIAFNLQEFILNLFRKSNEKVLRSVHFAGFINQIPKLFLEFIAILIILIIFYTTKEIQNDVNKQIFVLGLIAAAAFRLFPAINKILLSLNTFQYSKPSINVLTQIFKDDIENLKNENFKSNKNIKKFELNNFIEIKDLNFKYPTAENFIFKNLNLKISKGEHIGIIGVTGSGKSTFVDLILGILNPNQGEIYCDNNSIYNNLYYWRKLIGYVSQLPYLLDASVMANIAIGIDPKEVSEKQVLKCLEIANLKNLVLNLNKGLNTSIGERGAQLSGGQIQRLAIARALYKNPKILILDEATASVDSKTQRNILEDLNKFKNDITLISISHDKEALIHCDKIYELKDSGLILYK
tara:strand:+ start:1470 stop:3212 length:1743 start_codon:yes stop_codon:yes gene_type:complete